MDEHNAHSLVVCVKRLLRLPRGQSAKKVWLRAHFADQACEESPKLSMEDDGSITFNHQFKFTFEEIDLGSLNEFCNRPFVIDIFEAASVSKKSELKKQRIGAAVFDILPLIRGELEFDLELPVYLSSSTISMTDAPRPCMSLSVSTAVPINQSFSENPFNMLQVRVESMQSLPDDLVSQASEYVHVATFRPFLEADQPVVFSKSVISLPTEPVAHSGKKWMFTDGTVPDPAIIPGSESKSVETQFYEEVGELQEDADREHRYQSEHNKPKLLWSQEWRAFLDFEMLQRMKEHISSSPLLPIEVIRLPSAENFKAKKESEYAITFHGIAFVDLFQLLEPGERKIRGAYLVHPFDDEEYKQKLNCVSTLAREAAIMHRVYEAAAATQLLNDSSGAQSSTPTARQLAAKKAFQSPGDLTAVSHTQRESFPKVQMSSLSRAHLLQLSENRPCTIIPGAEFGPSRTFIVFEIVLDKPLVPKRVIEEIAVDLKPLISKKEKLPDRAQSAEKAVKEYHKAIIEVSQIMLTKMSKQNLQCMLDESSMFALFKEQLKFPIVNLVREKFFRSTPFATPEEFQKFLSDLFVYLVREMRQSMMVAFSPARKIGARSDLTARDGTASQLLLFAEEAEYTGALDWAHHYFQKRIVAEPHNADAWVDLAVFYLRQAKPEEAEECLRECLSVQDNNIKALTIMGTLLANRGLLEEASALFEAAITYEENNCQVWIIFGLFCESIADEKRAEYGFCKARRIENSALASERPRLPEQQVEERRTSRKEGPRSAADAISQSLDTTPKQLFPPSYRSSPFLQTAEVLLDAHLIKLTERAMAHHLIYMRKYLDHCLSYQPVPIPGTSLNDTPPVEEEGNCLKFLALPKQFPRSSPSNIAYVNELAQYHVLAAKVVMKKDLEDVSHRSISSQGKNDYAEAIARAQESLVTAIATDPENVEAWATLGELYSMADDRVSAIRYLERAMRLKSWPCRNSRLLQLRLAELCLKEEQFEKSKQIFLKCCQDAPSCLSWLGVGISCYRLSQLEDAEEALEEANALNNRNPTVWAYLSMICIEKRRVVEAEQSYKYAIKMGLNDKELLDELHGLQNKTGLGNPLQI